MQIAINHVSVIVKSIIEKAELFRQANYYIGPIESFDSEGTEEVYIGDPKNKALLLLQAPTKEGPYMRSFLKRGIGLHHIALDVDNLMEFVEFMDDIGWLLHPISLKNYSQKSAIYFARPGVGVLFEVEEKKIAKGNAFISGINAPAAKGYSKYIDLMKIDSIRSVEIGDFSIDIGKTKWQESHFQ
jgi:catechol 2,3-dioxygenase-like lactoylglutathione lyase family enzyme